MSNQNNVMKSQYRLKLSFECRNCGSDVHTILGEYGDIHCSDCSKKYTTSDLERVLDDQLTDRIDSFSLFREQAEETKQRYEQGEINKDEYNDELKKLYMDEYELEQIQEEFKMGTISQQEFIKKLDELNIEFDELEEYQSKLDNDEINLRQYTDSVTEFVQSIEAETQIHSVTNAKSPSIRIRDGSKIVMMWGSGSFIVTGVNSESQAKQYAHRVMDYLGGEIVGDGFTRTTSTHTFELDYSVNTNQLFDIVTDSAQYDLYQYEKNVWHSMDLIDTDNPEDVIKVSNSGGIVVNMSSQADPEKLFNRLEDFLESKSVSIENNMFMFEETKSEKSLTNEEIQILKQDLKS